MLVFFIPEFLDVLRFQTTLPGGYRGLFKLLPTTELLYELRIIALALELLQCPVYLVAVVNNHS